MKKKESRVHLAQALRNKEKASAGFANRKGYAKKPRWRLILLIATPLLLLCGVGAYFLSLGSLKSHEDKIQFKSTVDAVNIIIQRLQAASPEDVKWTGPTEGSCGYISGTGLQSGGWYCSAGTHATIRYSTPNLKEVVKSLESTVTHSTDVIRHKGTSSFKGFPDELQEGGGLTSTYYVLSSTIPCDINFQLQAGDVIANFSCGDGAKKSWYQNKETDPYLPGIDAWKEK